ncbi:MAG: acyltransferase [Pseudomonadota bacterium]
MSRRYFSNLDFVRFFAALWVVGHHYLFVAHYREGIFTVAPSHWEASLFRPGYLGVCIFFVLSGFLIAHVSQGARFLPFVAARVFRLMPAFWTCLAVTTVIMVALGASNMQQADPVTLVQGLANLFVLPQLFGFAFVDGVYWTLVYEFIFYGWAALFLAAGLLHRHLLGIVAVWLLVSVLNVSVFQSGLVERLCITYYSGAFAAGLLLWHLRKHGLTAANAVLLFCSVYALSFGVVEMASQPYVPAAYAGLAARDAVWVSAACVGVVLLALLLPSAPALRSFGLTIGAISYPLYLVHQELGYISLRAWPWQNQAAMAVLVIATFMLGLAWIVHHFAERPLRSAMVRLFMPVVDRVQLIADKTWRFTPLRSHQATDSKVQRL